MEWRTPFAAIEPIWGSPADRPHWAKLHSLTRSDVDALYPMAERYRGVRRTVDPRDKFLNAHPEALFS